MEGNFRKHLPPPFVSLPSSVPRLPSSFLSTWSSLCVQVGSQALGPCSRQSPEGRGMWRDGAETMPAASWRVRALPSRCTPLSCPPNLLASGALGYLPSPPYLEGWQGGPQPLVSRFLLRERPSKASCMPPPSQLFSGSSLGALSSPLKEPVALSRDYSVM